MTQPKRHSRLGLVINLALALVTFGLLGLVIYQKSDKIAKVFSRQLDLRWLLAGEAIYLTALVTTFIRWYMLVRVIEPKFTFRAAVLLGFIGNVFNLVLPGAVFGDLIKAAYLVRMQIKKTQAVASMVIDRILGLLGLFVLASTAGLFAWRSAPTDVRTLIVAAWTALAVGAVALAVIFSQALSRTFPQLLTKRSRLGLIASELREMSGTYRGRLDVVALALVLATFNHALNVVAFYLVGKMLYGNDMPTTLGQHFLMVPLTLFTMAVPLPFGALGVTEEVGEQLLKLVWHPSGALAVIGFRVIMYGSGLVGACVYLAKLNEVRELTASAHEIEEELTDGKLDDGGGE
jgi:glycosyltransferase 2 family protein